MKIRDLDQPLLISLTKARERRSGEAEYVYLVPELCRLTGLTDEMRADFHLMRDLGRMCTFESPSHIKEIGEFQSVPTAT